MSEFNEESRLKEALIEKNGKYCCFCGNESESLEVEHILGQKNIEKEFFEKYSELSNFEVGYEVWMYDYYNRNFEEESRFIGLSCNRNHITHSEKPNLKDVYSIMEKAYQSKNPEEMYWLVSNYQHTIPIIERVMKIPKNESISIQNKLEFDNLQDNLGRGNV